MRKKAGDFMPRIGVLFLYTVVIASLIVGMPGVASAAKKKAAGTAASTAGAIVDINTADEKTLEALPGIGKTTAKAIVAGRPYKSVDDLKRVKGMTDKKIQAIKGKVSVGGAAATSGVSSAAAQQTATAKKKVAGASAGAIVDINTADQKALEALPGVGKTTAKAIIAGRPYKSVDDLKRVKGMTDKKIQAIKEKVSVSGTAAVADTSARASQKASAAEKTAKETSSKAAAKLAPGQTVNINTAAKEQLEALPGIGSVKAQAIIDNRPYEKPEDIMKVKGIKEGTYNKIKGYITVR